MSGRRTVQYLLAPSAAPRTTYDDQATITPTNGEQAMAGQKGQRTARVARIRETLQKRRQAEETLLLAAADAGDAVTAAETALADAKERQEEVLAALGHYVREDEIETVLTVTPAQLRGIKRKLSPAEAETVLSALLPAAKPDKPASARRLSEAGTPA
jgi:hypothetical protein